jgi:peroxiredoxin
LELTIHFSLAKMMANSDEGNDMSNDATMTDQLNAVGEEAKSHLPAEVLETFQSDQHELDAAGVPDTVVKIGTRMPDATLLNVTGKSVTLGDVLGQRPAVIVFYRGAWCPYCNITLRSYQTALEPALSERGATLIAISPQKPDGSLSMQEKHDLTFPVLSDPLNTLARALGIVSSPAPKTEAAQLKLGLDISTFNVDDEADLPMPTVLIVDEEGTIRWIDVHPNYTTRSEPDDILDAYDSTIGDK